MKNIERLVDKSRSFEEKLNILIDCIRPKNKKEFENIEQKMQCCIELFTSNDVLRSQVANDLVNYFFHVKIATNIAQMGILSKNGFKDEITNRMYNKFLPSPPKIEDFEYFLSTIFYKSNDAIWVAKISHQLWIDFFDLFFSNGLHCTKLKEYLFHELLYAVQILSIWLAAEEFDANFIRLDAKLSGYDSALMGLHGEIFHLTNKLKSNLGGINECQSDFEQIKVLLQQSKEQISNLKKKSVNLGISIALTYQFERIEQIMTRLETVLGWVSVFGTQTLYTQMLTFFTQYIAQLDERTSIAKVVNQNLKILARSITNNTSQRGEHYVTDTSQEYLKMFWSACGAGVVISLMALNKIFITKEDFSVFIETIFVSLNYGLGFVLIHLFGFTVATKQPAMTASYFAKAVEENEHKNANQEKLAALFVQVSRSQFAAVMGNVSVALVVSICIAIAYGFYDNHLMNTKSALYYQASLEPMSALFFAAIAGVWLFCSGLISGYFDNRANYLDLKNRYLYHPILKKITPLNFRKKLATYLHNNHGALAGNFFFGVLLGITPFLGYIFQIDIDIRHIAFGAANLGYSSVYLPFEIIDFIVLLLFVFMIGFVNLTVSFFLALKVSLKSRDVYFGSIGNFLKLLVLKIIKNPKELFFP